MTITARPSRLIGVAETDGFIQYSFCNLSVEDLPPWGGNNLQAIRKLIRDCQKSDQLVSGLSDSKQGIYARMKNRGVGLIDSSLYYVGRSYRKHGWRHSTLTAI